MPYITADERKNLNLSSPGQLNFMIHEILQDYIGASESYTKYNEVVGVLECVKLELYRRAVAAYETEKMKENGDVLFYQSRAFVND